MARSQSKILTDNPQPNPFQLFNGNGAMPKEPSPDNNGVLRIEHGDGSVTIDFNPQPESTGEQNEHEFDANLAGQIDQGELDSIATDLLDGIQRDEDSRKDWIDTRARGISLLGLKLKTPKSDMGTAVEGMSGIDHPLILEATINFQATARAELLPASGPVKVRNDGTPLPPDSIQDTSAKKALQQSLFSLDEMGQALEKDMNHYLTVTATEYVPDTDRMLFYVAFGGDGFKKVYNCPIRRRPVSESVDAEDFIVSNAATDLKNCGRVTHRIRMRQSVLKRMQILGAYRDVQLSTPTVATTNEVDKKKEEISGIKTSNIRPQDRDYELYETYCELDIDKFAPKQFKGKSLPLPYRVTVEKSSRQILDIRRNWEEDDEQCLAKQFFVQFPFVRGLGFYGLGYVHTLGNTTITLTAAWREMIDAGMYASFPGFLYDKQVGRQLTNTFRIPPGGGVGIDVGPNKRIQDSIMPVPYKEVGAGFTSFITHVEEVGRRLATSGNVSVGEGRQDAPVGTTLALIEQATKAIDAAHKRLHAAQAEEFQLLKARFREDPEAFWRFNKTPAIPWKKAQFIKALNDANLVPVADPNNPTSLHRIAKAVTIKELAKSNPEIYDKVAVDMRIMNITGIDPTGLFLAKETPAGPDPRIKAIEEKAAAQKQMSQLQLLETQIRATVEKAKLLDKAKDRESRETLEKMKLQIEEMELLQQQIQHAADEEKAFARTLHELNLKAEMALSGQKIEEMAAFQKMLGEGIKDREKINFEAVKVSNKLGMERSIANDKRQREDEISRAKQQREDETFRAKNAREDEAHQAKIRREDELNSAKVRAARALARAKPKSKAKGK